MPYWIDLGGFQDWKLLPIKNIEEPVEAHVYTQWHIDQDASFLFQSFIQGSQAVNDLHHIHHMFTGLQVVLIEDLQSRSQSYQIHWKGKKKREIQPREEAKGTDEARPRYHQIWYQLQTNHLKMP